jgi:hypothetical protein
MRTSFAFVLVGLAACGGPAKDPEGPTGAGGGDGGAKAQTPGDVSFEVSSIEIKGMMFEPEALGRPGMPLVHPKKKTTLDKQRQTFEKTKDPVQKEAHAAILATMLYEKAKNAAEAEQKQLWGDARQVLRDAAAHSGDKVDEITLRLLASYELLLDDYAAAEKAWAGFVTKAPKDKDIVYNRAWWAYTLLRQFKTNDALEVIKDLEVTDKQPELAYVAAWAKWRAGDEAGAWQAIIAAAKGWGQNPGREALNRDILLFAGRTDVPVNDAFHQLVPIFAKSKDQQYELLAKLGLEAYHYAGRWADGVAAIDKAIAVIGDKLPPNDRPVLRYQQADFTVRLDDPVAAAKYAKQALDALPACGAKCTPQTMAQLVEGVYVMGRLFHILYATANDVRYFQPAADLYQESVPKITANNDLRAQGVNDQKVLDQTFKGMKAGHGTHDKDAIGALLKRRNQEVQACYEHGLAGNPKLAGNLVVNLETDQTGVIKGVATEPKAGLADMAAVAGCVTEQVKTWKLPTRAQPGTTRIKLMYQLARKS